MSRLGFTYDEEGKTIYPEFYFRWRSMRSRCQSKSSREYIRYGARGIHVCKEWQDFKTFQTWCYETFEEGKTIDRIDNDGPYAPWNCRWATPAEQQVTARRTQARRDGIAMAKSAQVAALHKEYGDPRTRKNKQCSKCNKTKLIKFFRGRAGSRVHEQVAYCRPCEYLYHKSRGWK